MREITCSLVQRTLTDIYNSIYHEKLSFLNRLVRNGSAKKITTPPSTMKKRLHWRSSQSSSPIVFHLNKKLLPYPHQFLVTHYHPTKSRAASTKTDGTSPLFKAWNVLYYCRAAIRWSGVKPTNDITTIFYSSWLKDFLLVTLSLNDARTDCDTLTKMHMAEASMKKEKNKHTFDRFTF